MGYLFDAMNQAGPPEPPEDSDAQQHSEAIDPDATQDANAPAEDWDTSDGTAQLVLNTRGRHRIDDRLVAVTSPGSFMSEEYRSTRTSMLARWQHQRHLVHTITSATPQEGKTLTTLNMGMIFAELRMRRCLVLEADLRLPTCHRLLNQPMELGLGDYLRGDCELNETIRRVGDTRLDLIPAGTRANDQAVQLLSGHRMRQLVEQLRHRYDHVLIDTPPVLELADAGIIGALSDEVMMVVRVHRTSRSLVEQACRILQSYHAPPAGIIATDRRQHRRRYYSYRYGYRYHERYTKRKAA